MMTGTSRCALQRPVEACPWLARLWVSRGTAFHSWDGRHRHRPTDRDVADRQIDRQADLPIIHRGAVRTKHLAIDVSAN